jgi:hypothetical protein
MQLNSKIKLLKDKIFSSDSNSTHIGSKERQKITLLCPYFIYTIDPLKKSILTKNVKKNKKFAQIFCPLMAITLQ